MKTVSDSRPVRRIVKEAIRLDACSAGDRLYVPHTPRGCFGSIGVATLCAIKPIAKGGVQIKYRKGHGSTGKVLKVDLPADLVVERTRDAVEADGPDAGVPERRTVRHEGIDYRSVDPTADVGALVLEAIARRAPSLTVVIDAPGRGKAQALARMSALLGYATLAAPSTARAESPTTDRDMEIMDGWLGALSNHGILQPGAKDRLMSSIWTDQELSDGRPHPGSVVIDG